jgi:hypothetical protein
MREVISYLFGDDECRQPIAQHLTIERIESNAVSQETLYALFGFFDAESLSYGVLLCPGVGRKLRGTEA